MYFDIAKTKCKRFFGGHVFILFFSGRLEEIWTGWAKVALEVL